MPTRVSQKRIDEFVAEASQRLGIAPEQLEELSFYLDDEFTFLRRRELAQATLSKLAGREFLNTPLAALKKKTTEEVSDLIFISAFMELAENNQANNAVGKITYVLSQHRRESIDDILDSILI